MKNFLIKATSFLVIFVLLFLLLQNVLHYRWSGNESLYTRNIDYAAHEEGTVDVLCFGTSEIFAAYDPIVTYAEEGITGYSFAISYRSAITTYYQLLYALKYQTPKVVICDFACMYDDQLPAEVEPLYRKVVDCMPDKELKNELIKVICDIDPDQSWLSWKFPMLRYHSMWNELKKENFIRDYTYDKDYPQYSKGALLRTVPFEGRTVDIVPENWDYDHAQTVFSDISIEYYDKFIEECQSRGIQVVAVMPPKVSAGSEYASRWDAMKEYFDSRGVDYLNYNTYKAVKRLGVSMDTDFYNAEHLNAVGSIKFSKIFAKDLAAKYDFTDHRGDSKFAERWDKPLKEFNEVYKEVDGKIIVTNVEEE